MRDLKSIKAGLACVIRRNPTATNNPMVKDLRDVVEEVERLQQQVETEQQWAAFVRCCALSGEIPSSRGEFDANQQNLRKIKENQSGTQSTKPGPSPEPET